MNESRGESMRLRFPKFGLTFLNHIGKISYEESVQNFLKLY